MTTPEFGEPLVAGGPIRPAWTWLSLVGHRLAVASAFPLGVLAILVAVDAALGLLDPAQPVPLFYVFGGLIGGNFTLITIVLSMDQLVISRQIGSPGELRQQIENTNAYREVVEKFVEVPVTPVTPTEFLLLLVRSTASAVESIHEESEGIAEG